MTADRRVAARRVPRAACQPVHAGRPSSVHWLILYHPRNGPATDRRRAGLRLRFDRPRPFPPTTRPPPTTGIVNRPTRTLHEQLLISHGHPLTSSPWHPRRLWGPLSGPASGPILWINNSNRRPWRLVASRQTTKLGPRGPLTPKAASSPLPERECRPVLFRCAPLVGVSRAVLGSALPFFIARLPPWRHPTMRN